MPLVLLVATLPACGSSATGDPLASAAPAGASLAGARTSGGDGGALLRVTTLAADGPGSLRAALAEAGPRTVVFDVAGVVDLDGRSLLVREPHLTVAGVTAPSPGLTLVRGGLRIQTHDVVVRHLRLRPGEAGHGQRSGWEVDALTVAGPEAHDVVIEHCSLSWATDENLAASGPRFGASGGAPDDPGAWRAGTARRVTFRNNLVAEALGRSTHSEGEHSKGLLIHDNVTDVAVVGNLFAHNRERNPLLKGGASGIVANNLIYDPGEQAVAYALHADEWAGHPHETGRLAVIGNVLKLGPSSAPDLAFVDLEGDGPVELELEGNLVLDRDARPLAPRLHDHAGLRRAPTARVRVDEAFWPSAEVFERVLEQAGARPWDRDAIDERIVRQVRAGTGRIIDSEGDVGGYPR